MEEKPQGSEQLFAVFFLSIYSLFVIPYTIYKLCHAASPDEVVKPWEAVRPHPGTWHSAAAVFA